MHDVISLFILAAKNERESKLYPEKGVLMKNEFIITSFTEERLHYHNKYSINRTRNFRPNNRTKIPALSVFQMMNYQTVASFSAQIFFPPRFFLFSEYSVWMTRIPVAFYACVVYKNARKLVEEMGIQFEK